MLTLFGKIELEYPAMLCFLAVLPVIGYFAYRTGVTSTKGQRWGSVVCRSLIVVLLVVAFAGTSYRWKSEQRFVIFATDISRSVSGESREAAKQFITEALEHRDEHQSAFFSFAGLPGDLGPEETAGAEGLDELVSDPASAVNTALASIPSVFVPQIVLLSDGNETSGDLAKAALASDVPISVLPLKAFPFDEACVTEVIAPAQASRFADTPVEVVVQSNHEDKGASVELSLNGNSAASRQFALSLGENRIRFEVPINAAQDTVIQAKLTAANDTITENNQRRTTVFAAKRVRVLLVDAEPGSAAPLQAVLAGQGFDVTLRGPGQLNAADDSLAAYDLVILSDVQPNSLAADQLDALDRYVGELGGGLTVLGGEKTFGEADYRGSVLERMLPVKAVEMVETKKTVMAMMLVIDRSGSMVEERRMDLAKQAAKLSVGVLNPHDKAGVMAFSDFPKWVAELAPVSDKSDLLRRIDTLQPGGQTNMFQAVERAFLALEQTIADRRHMILLTDGIPAPGDYCKIAGKMAAAGVTLSTVSISRGAEQDLLKKMANIVGGRHRHCDDPADVPNILVQETRAATSEGGLRDFRPFVLRSLPGLNVAEAPPLGGYVPTSPKQDAEPLLMAGPDPLRTWWRYGAGVTVAFTSDAKDRWAKRWLAWPGYTDFWKRLVRHAARRPGPSPLDVRMRRSRGNIAVTLDAVNEDLTYANTAQVSIELVKPRQEPLNVRQIAPGRHQAQITIESDGEYQVEASFEAGSQESFRERRSMFIDYPDELNLKTTNEALLKSVAAATGGTYAPKPADMFTPDGRTVDQRTSLWFWLVLAATLLLVVDVGLRRLRF